MSVNKENKWLKKNFPPPNENCSSPNQCYTTEYENLILQNSDGTVVLNETILASDLSTLACDSWLSLSVIQGFVDLLNN